MLNNLPELWAEAIPIVEGLPGGHQQTPSFNPTSRPIKGEVETSENKLYYRKTNDY